MDKDQYLKELGIRIINLRKSKGISQIELSIRLGIEDSALRRIEKGKINTGIYTIYKISEALEIPLADLLTNKS